MRCVTALDLDSNKLGPATAVALASSPHAASLRTLKLAHNAVGDAGVITLSRSSTLVNLEWLALSENQYTEACTDAVLDSPLFARLKHLSFRYRGPRREQLKEKFGSVISMDF
jgi:hypothetical protein